MSLGNLPNSIYIIRIVSIKNIPTSYPNTIVIAICITGSDINKSIKIIIYL